MQEAKRLGARGLPRVRKFVNRAFLASLLVTLIAGIALLAVEYGLFQKSGSRSLSSHQATQGAAFNLVQEFFSLISRARCEEAAQVVEFPFWTDGVDLDRAEWPTFCRENSSLLGKVSRWFDLPNGVVYLYSENYLGEAFLSQQDPQCRPFRYLRAEIYSGRVKLKDLAIVEFMLAPDKDKRIPELGRWNINSAFVRLGEDRPKIIGLTDSWLHEWEGRKCGS